MSIVIAVYPGTFDPLTRGHEDLVRRAAGLFAKLIVGVADSSAKRPVFTLEIRPITVIFRRGGEVHSTRRRNERWN